jgi:Tfp pilus assembly protein PilF
LRRAHEINPNDALALAILAFAEATCGDPKIGVDYAQRALRLSPRDPARFIMLNNLGWSHFWAGDYAQGAVWAQRAIDESPDLPAPHMSLIVNCVGLGDIARANAELQVMRKLAPEMVETRLAGQWMSTNAQYRMRATNFLRIAAGLGDPSATDSSR